MLTTEVLLNPLTSTDDGSRTYSKPMEQLRSVSSRSCLVHIYPATPEMGSRHMLSDYPLMLGRAPGCDITIDDQSISRRHALLQPEDDGYQIVDLGSTNGTFINDQLVPRGFLKDGDYLRLGNAIFRYLAGGNVEADYHEEIYRLTISDALTGACNKRHLLEYLDRELSRAIRHQRPLAVILLDIDEFKSINDELGHLAGDFILRELAQRIRSTVQAGDLFARFGGEEFALVLVESTLEQAAAVAENIRRIIAETPFRCTDVCRTVTVSLGVASLQDSRSMSPSQLLQLADDKLYQAKRCGRNRVMT